MSLVYLGNLGDTSMKPIGLLAPCIWLVVLLLSSSAVGARANGATGYSNNLEACKNLDYKKCKWSEAEKFAWGKIRVVKRPILMKMEKKPIISIQSFGTAVTRAEKSHRSSSKRYCSRNRFERR